jgi:hypothetical protein
LSLKGYQGNIKKSAVVYSNDPQNAKTVLALQGIVKTLIDVRPSTRVSFRGLAEKVLPSIVELVASGGQAFHIQEVESDLDDKVSHELETVEEGKHYRVKIANRIDQGNYSGVVRVQTDLPQKSEVLIRVNAFIEGEIRVQPQMVMVGKLGAQQPPRTGKVRVTSNRGSAFRITKLTYDQSLLQVVQQPVPNEAGFSLEITPRIENVPAGDRKQSVVVVETDARPSESYEIQVHIMNAVEGSPGARRSSVPGEAAQRETGKSGSTSTESEAESTSGGAKP